MARLLGPVLLAVLAAAIAGFWSLIGATLGFAADAPAAGWVHRIAEATAWFAAAWGLVRVLDMALWHGVLERRSGVRIPRLLSDLVAGLVLVVAAIVVLGHVFALPVAGLVTTSGVAIAIIGFALRDMIASLFSGIAINLEHPYQIGDWIEIETGQVGQVLEVSWLTTRAVTRDGIGLVIPNARLATAPFRNYNQPEAAWRDSIAITLDYALPAERIERILLAAMNAVPQVAAQRNRPDVKIEAFTELGVRWLARYWVGDYGAMPETRYAVQRSVLRQMHYAGIALPYPKRDLFLARMPPRALDHRQHLDAILGRNELFADLAEAELRALAERARERFCVAGVPIVRAGEPGASLFVVVEGLLRVLRPSADGDERQVDEMTPGTAFGEFSLLTGAPRSATIVPQGDAVVYEITKDDLEPILKRRQDLAERLSRVLAERQLGREQEAAILGHRTATGGAPPPAHVWLERMRAFFGLVQDRGSG